MKKIVFLSSLFLAMVFVANAQNNENHTLQNHREEIKKVIITEDKGVVRGLDFGATIEEIKASEKGIYVADGKDFAIYKQPLNKKEFAEIIYYLDEEKKIKGFGIEFIIKEEDFILEENIVLDFEKYFTERYGDFTVNARNDEVWDSGAYTVEMGDSSEGGSVLEIEIEIFPKK